MRRKLVNNNVQENKNTVQSHPVAATAPQPGGHCSDSVHESSSAHVSPPDQPSLIHCIGIGNPIMGDDGIGLAILEQLQQLSQNPSVLDATGVSIRYIDGGTSGMELLPDIQDPSHLLILDAVTGPGEPGDVVVLEGDQIPRLLQSRLSPHQVGLLDLLSAARLLGKEPQHVAVVGVVAQAAELGIGLSPAVEPGIAKAADAACAVLQRWINVS